MANAVATAPSKKDSLIEIHGQKVKEGSLEHEYLTREFDTEKRYVFELAAKNLEREHPIMDARTNRPLKHQEFRPYQNLVYTTQIVFNGKRVVLRYYDGCDTIFASDQPKDKDSLDQFIRQTKRRAFLNGKIVIEGNEYWLLLYMLMCSWNTASPFRTKTASEVFVTSDANVRATKEASRIDAMEEALKLAREATMVKMNIHASYLGIPTFDYDSGNELTEKELRSAYRNEAARDPKAFIDSYGNKAIEIKYYINKALETRVIDNRFNPNKATWGKNNTEICDISGLRSQEAIADRIYEFTQSEAGEEFLIQLKALYN